MDCFYPQLLVTMLLVNQVKSRFMSLSQNCFDFCCFFFIFFCIPLPELWRVNALLRFLHLWLFDWLIDCVFLSHDMDSHNLSSWMLYDGYEFVTGILPCRREVSGSVRIYVWYACIHRLGLSL